MIKQLTISICAALMLAACTSVDICEDEASGHPHSAWMTLSYDLSDVKGLQKIDVNKIGVMVYRVVKQWRTWLTTDLNAKGNFVSSFGADTKAGRSYSPGSAMPKDSNRYILPPGDYRFYCATYAPDQVDYNNFTSSLVNSSQSSDIFIKYKTYKLKDAKLRNKLLTSWNDYNAYTNYVQPDNSTILYGSTEIVKFDKDAEVPVNIKMNSSTALQSIQIEFDIKKDVSKTAFTVDSVWIDLSGIAYGFSVTTGNIDISSTAKMMSKMKLTQANGATQDDFSNTRIYCRDTLLANGLVRPYDLVSETSTVKAADRLDGPGILQAIIFTTSNETYNTSTGLKPKRKRFQCMVNLYKILQSNPSLDVTGDGTQTKQHSDVCKIKIANAIPLDGEHINLSYDGDGGAISWKEANDEDIYIDL